MHCSALYTNTLFEHDLRLKLKETRDGVVSYLVLAGTFTEVVQLGPYKHLQARRNLSNFSTGKLLVRTFYTIAARYRCRYYARNFYQRHKLVLSHAHNNNFN
jgi:hypothetical protein